MLCCCPKGSPPKATDQAEVHKEEPTTPTAKIQTGKGALSSSNQSIPNEASLDKTTVEATKREKSPITQQPGKQENQPAAAQPQPTQQTTNHVQEGKPSADSKPVELSEIDTEIVTAKTVSETQSSPKQLESLSQTSPTQSEPLSSAKQSSESQSQAAPKQQSDSDKDSKFVSTIKVSSKALETQAATLEGFSNPSIPSNPLAPVLGELDKLEQSVTDSEGLSNWEAKQAVPGLASQLKVITSKVISTATTSPQIMSDQLQAAVSRLEAVASRLEGLASLGGGGGAASGDSGAVSPFVAEYEASIISGPLAKFLSISNDIGGDVKAQADIVKAAFSAQKDFLVVASKSKQPDQGTFAELLKPSSTKLADVQNFRENNRRSEFFNHLSAVSESIAALGWVTMSPTPGPFVKDMAEAGQFYTNRVLKDYKEKDPRHVEWTKSWLAVFTELQAYIKQFHTTGLSWNPKGGDAKSVAGSAGSCGAPPPPPPGGPPPPPPPPPPMAPVSDGGADDAASRNALFAEINKGADITKGLKKVTDDQKTHKNPALRQGPAPFKPSPAPKPGASPKPAPKAPAAVTKPPVFELEGKKWVIEYQKDNKSIVVDNTELKQSIYAFKCEGSVIQVKGKINSIILDSCKKTAIVFDDLVSSLEFVNCQSMQAQVMGKLPTVSIDKTDGCQIYLSKDSLDTEIVSAKSSEMNILVPSEGGDMKEFALPEQYKTTYNGKTMVTVATESV